MPLHKALLLVGVACCLAVAAGANSRVGWLGLGLVGLTLLL